MKHANLGVKPLFEQNNSSTSKQWKIKIYLSFNLFIILTLLNFMCLGLVLEC